MLSNQAPVAIFHLQQIQLFLQFDTSVQIILKGAIFGK